MKKVGDENASQTLKANANGEVTLGTKLGIIGVEVKVSVVKAGNAVIDFFSAGYEYIKNRVSDAVKTPFNTEH